MLYACAARFDMIGNLEKFFWFLRGTKQGLNNSWIHEHVTSTLDYINIQKIFFI